jgi:hypothetical protein
MVEEIKKELTNNMNILYEEEVIEKFDVEKHIKNYVNQGMTSKDVIIDNVWEDFFKEVIEV